MRMEANLSQRQEMRMKLAPQIIQSIEILQLPILELQDTIKAELEENPTLEIDEEEAQDEHAEAKGIEQPAALGEQADPETPKDDTTAMLEMLDRQREDDYWSRTRGSSFDASKDKKLEALMNTPARSSSLQEHLMEQWTTMDLPEKVRRIGEYIIENIDDSGYLTHPIESLTDATGKIIEEGLLDSINRMIRLEAEEFIDSLRKLDPDQFGEGKTVRKQVMRGIAEDDRNAELKKLILKGMNDALELSAPIDDVLRPALAVSKDIYTTLGIIQKLEPAGVGARNTKECLLLQLDREDDDYEIKKELIDKYLEDIRLNKLPKISRETGRPMEDIMALVDSIKKMNPKPGANYSAESVPYVLPDVIVNQVEGDYEIRLEDGYIPQLRVSSHYRDMLANKNSTTEEKDFIRRKIEAAKRLISSIEQRQATLYRIAVELVRIQKDFLDHGVNHLHPLRMQEVADTLGLHVSTVSRAISDKYIQTPRGIFPMKFFFSGATESTQGDSQSRVSVQSRIQELVDGENKSNPLSDGDIVAKLKAEGLDIARRTVTKYRKALKIASSRQRKQF